MEVDLGSRQARLLVAVSGIWLLIALAVGADAGQTYSDFEVGEFFGIFLIVASPVLLFWVVCWIMKARIPFRFGAADNSERPRWVEVTDDVAKAHPLYGVSGWLGLVMLGLMVSTLSRFTPLTDLVMPTSAHPGWYVTAFSTAISDMMLFPALYVACIALAVRHSRHFPAFLIAVWTADMTSSLLTYSIFADLAGVPTEVMQEVDRELAKQSGRFLVGGAIWITYLLRSARVNVTFRKRVRSDDPHRFPSPPLIDDAVPAV
jgi:hypothetical protein